MTSGVSDNALLTLKDMLRKQMDSTANYILGEGGGGGCKNFEEYRYYTGIIQGLALAERDLLDLNQRIEEA